LATGQSVGRFAGQTVNEIGKFPRKTDNLVRRPDGTSVAPTDGGRLFDWRTGRKVGVPGPPAAPLTAHLCVQGRQ
jgi:hypothetical protein